MNGGESLDPIFRELLAQVGAGNRWHVERLRGGANNRVFLARSPTAHVVIKQYHADKRDDRDRLDHEFAFLQFAWDNGIRNLPQPIAHDAEHGLGLYSFVEGAPFAPGNVGENEVRAAIDFIRAVNRVRQFAHHLPSGSEACFCLEDHLSLVERRVSRLQTLDPGVPHADAARHFVEASLVPAFAQVRARALEQTTVLGIDRRRQLLATERCLSPSDFGFHNALRRRDATIAFLDFEYAGWDDPAKLVCDFFCQPEVPVPAVYFPLFAREIAETIGTGETAVSRFTILLNLYRVKWACIMLNEFLPVGATRRRFSTDHDDDHRCSEQLAKARRAIASIGV